MPILTGSISEADGAVVELLVGVHAANREARQRVGFPVPPRQRVRVQIDTGATLSSFAPFVFTALDLKPVDTVRVRTPSTWDEPALFNQYLVSIGLDAEGIEMHVDELFVFESHFTEADHVQGLLGRDFLKHCLFNYNGQAGTFCLAS
jgi:hypothetical protein